jgi:DNA-binding response OmpR family regulator
VVDDHREIRDLLARYLARHQFRVRALSGRTESIWDSQRAVVVIQTGCWVEEASHG